MNLRCKPGDLALITTGKTSAGMLVTCIEVAEPRGPAPYSGKYGPCWLIDRKLKWSTSHSNKIYWAPFCPDSWLTPIRPEPDPEESFSWQTYNEGAKA